MSISPPPQPSPESESLPNTPPELTPGFDTELNARINEDLRKSISRASWKILLLIYLPLAVDIIPCDALTIGTWKRLRSEEHSLVAYVSDSRECLTWFVHNAGRSLKMIIPFHIIMHTELDDTSGTAAGTIEISFILSRPPLFFFEAKIVDPGTMVTNRKWQECHDWTKDCQGTYCLRHTIRGPTIALHRFLETLQPKLASLDRKANLRRRPMSWHQSPSSASEYSCPTPQGSISPLEMRKRLPPAEVFESYSPEASAQSSCSGPMGYYYSSQIPDSATFSDQPSPSSSEDQPSPTASGGDQSSPQATTPQYISLDGSPVPEAFEPSFVLTLPPIVPPIARLHQDSPMVIAGDYQHHTSPSPNSGLEPMNGCLTDQAFAVPSNAAAAFPDPSPRTGAPFSNSSFTPIPVTTRYYTLDYGLATGCSSSTSSPLRSTRSSTLPPTLFAQPQYNTLPAGSLGPDTSSYYFPTNTPTNYVLSSNTSSTLPPPPATAFNRLDLDQADIPSGLTATAPMPSFYPEAPAATASMDPGLNPDHLFQYLQQPLQQHQQPEMQHQQQHQQPTLIAPTPFSASTYRLQGDWIAGLQQWEQERNQQRHHQQHL